MTCVRALLGDTEYSLVDLGVHHGSSLSPCLFTLILDEISQEIEGGCHGVCFLPRTMLVAKTRTELNDRLDILRTLLVENGLSTNIVKTIYLVRF